MNIDLETFKDVCAQWASGVTVVTTCDGDERHGMTVSSFTSVSLHPPLVSFNAGKELLTHRLITRSGVFAVNILRESQLDWGMRFAGMLPEYEADRFTGIDLATAATGSPILPNVGGWMDCRVRHTFDVGDHTIFVGEVLKGYCANTGDPLLYFNRGWRRLARLTER